MFHVKQNQIFSRFLPSQPFSNLKSRNSLIPLSFSGDIGTDEGDRRMESYRGSQTEGKGSPGRPGGGRFWCAQRGSGDDAISLMHRRLNALHAMHGTAPNGPVPAAR